MITRDYGNLIVGDWYCKNKHTFYPRKLKELKPEWKKDNPLCPKCKEVLEYDEYA